MANIVFNFLHKTRYLLVAALVSALLSTPFSTEAESTTNIKLTASNTIAGESTEIFISNAEPYNEILIEITKPDGNKFNLNTASNASGISNIQIDSKDLTKAGSYLATAKNLTKNSAYSKYISFQVSAAELSEENSSIKLSKNTANSGEKIQATVKLEDSFGNPISGHQLILSSDRETDKISSPEKTTNANGIINFYIIGSEKGIAKIIAKDIDSNKNFNTKLAFTSGNSLERTKIIFAEESGSIASFNLSGLDAESKVGDKQSITVTAVDEAGLTVTDYTGTVHFSSTDANATMPSDYTFIASDLGQHNFDLGFNFVTPDTQSITATDEAQSTIKGSISTVVVTSTSSLDQSIDYQSTYETTDYEREDKFTLISPASGSISDDTIDVSGSGDYGKTAVIYLNDEEAAMVEITKDNSFEYSLEDLEDGTYEIYVDIAQTTVNDEGEVEVTSKIESSEVETIVIDTTAPELGSLTFSPGTSVSIGEEVSATVISENGLKNITLEINGVLNALKESTTAGKYEGDLLIPSAEGTYPVNVVLEDQLGNEADYRAKDTIIVGASATGTVAEPIVETVAKVETLDAPTGLSSASGREEVTISWEPVTAPTGTTISFYRVYYGPSKTELFASSDTLDASTSWLLTGLNGGEKYYFAVVAVDSDDNEGEQSDPIVGTPLKKSTESALKPSAPEPELTTATLPESSPETGPATNILIALSLMGSLGYLGVRKLAKQETF